MNTHHLNPASEARAERLHDDPDYRVLRALPPPYASMPAPGSPPEGRCVALVDLETTGLYAEHGSIIEIAVKLLFVDETGALLGHLPIFNWLEDPGHALDPAISRLTGLGDADLRGKRIDDEGVARLLDRADLLIAHNAAFDAPWIERRWPSLAGMPWACSLQEVDWMQLGCEGRSQHHLILQHGAFSKAHRAAADVWALHWLLQQSRPYSGGNSNRQHHDSRDALPSTHLQRLLAASDTPSWRIEAVGTHYNQRHLLQQRGYRWDGSPSKRVWWREVTEDGLEAEQVWLQRQDLRAPLLVPVTAKERHR